MASIVLGSDQIQIAGRTAPGAYIGRMATYRLTDSTDISVSTTCASGGVNFGTGQSITLAAGDLLGVQVVQAQFSLTPVNDGSLGCGINVNSTNYFQTSVYNATNGSYPPGVQIPYDGTIIKTGALLFTRPNPIALFDVSALGISTGAQTVQVKFGKSAIVTSGITLSDTFTVKGTLLDTVVHLFHFKA